MKSFFKKLSLVLAAAMVITMLPAQIAKAAPTALKIAEESKKAEAVVSPTYNLKVNDTIDLTFVGAKGYDAAAAATKKWSSKDEKVATVDKNGVVKALKAGQTVITITCTAKGVEYQGTATVNVSDSKVEVKQTAYDTISVIFASEGDAASAKANIKAYVVQRGANGIVRPRDTKFKAEVDSKDKNVVNIYNLVNGLEYQIVVPGDSEKYSVTMNAGDPAEILVYYEAIPVLSDKNGADGKDIFGTTLTSNSTLPTVEVFDANGVMLEVKEDNLVYKQIEKKGKITVNTGKPDKGKVTVNSGDTEAEITVQVTYKYKDAAGKEQSIQTKATAHSVKYDMPQPDVWAESIVATDKTGKDIVYNDDYYVKINVNDTLDLAYYFLDTAGTMYTGKNVKSTVAYDETPKGGKKISTIGNSNFIYYFEKDTDENIVSLTDAETQQNGRTKITGWNVGTQKISLYRVKGKTIKDRNSNVDVYLGTITVEVDKQAEINQIVFEDGAYSVKGWKDAEPTARKAKISFSLLDQYDKPISGKIKWSATGIPASAVTINYETAADKKGKGTIEFDFTNIEETPDEPIAMKITPDVYGTKVEETLNVYCAKVDPNGSKDFKLSITATNATIKNKNFATATSVNDILFKIQVAQYIDDALYNYVPFWMVSDKFEDSTACKKDNGDYLVVIYNSNNTPIASNAEGDAILPSTSTAVSATKVNGYQFDMFKNNAVTVAEGLTTPGTYKIVLYQANGENVGDIDVAYVTIDNKMELLDKFSTTKTLKADTNNHVADDAKLTIDTSVAYGDDGVDLVKSIVGQMWAFYDKDSSGTVNDGELNTIAALTGGFEVLKDRSSWVKGAESTTKNSTELYIKYVTIKFSTPVSGYEVEQVIELNKKFDLKN